jgi:cytochrome c biogenesis factor
LPVVLKALAAILAGIVAVWTKLKTKANIGLLLVIVALVAVIAVMGIKHNKPAANKVAAPKVAVKKVVENPTAKQVKTATAAITEQSAIKVSGTTKKTGATVKIPVSGTVKTTYIDSESGQQVGQGAHKVTGETTVTVEDDTVSADTVINDTNQIAVVVDPAKSLKNEAGYFCDGDQKVYYKRNVITFGKKVELSGYVGGTLDIDDVDESRVEAGVRVRW